MPEEKNFIHPYIPNSVPEIKEQMLNAIGVKDVEMLYKEIPERLRFKGKLNIPGPILSECDLKSHVMEILSKNSTCIENLSFLGGGCWQHYVPAVVDEIIGRSEVLTAYAGQTFSDLGKFHIHFEFQSELAELLDMDVVSLPVYSWGCAAGFAVRMAARMTGRNEVLVPKLISPERLGTIKTFCGPTDMPVHIEVKEVDFDSKTGLMDLTDLKRKISGSTAAVYYENPTYLGPIESNAAAVSEVAHANGVISIVGADPISLGVLMPPSEYGADIAVGTIQPLGIHMQSGGGDAGFIASRDEEKYVSEYPSFIVGMTSPNEMDEFGFAWCGFDSRTSYGVRDENGQIRNEAKDFTGTSAGLWAVAAAVYMALLGPHGFEMVGKTIIQRCNYAVKLLSAIKGVKAIFASHSFKEFVINFDETGKSVKEINKALLRYNIFGGKDISQEYPDLGESALYCVTEMHTQEDIKKLSNALREVVEK